MKGIQFGNYHSWDDFALILTAKEIGTPSIKTENIDIPGGDGVLDLTEFFGETKYGNRPLSFEFSTIVPQSDFMRLFSQVQNALHGQKMRIVLDNDAEWYYTGRISVSPWKAEKSIGKFTIDCDCEPYKTKVNDTVISVAVTEETTVILQNSKKRVIPTIDITGEINLTFGTNFWALTEGRYDLPAVVLEYGDNEITLSGAGTATFTYREGGL